MKTFDEFVPERSAYSDLEIVHVVVKFSVEDDEPEVYVTEDDWGITGTPAEEYYGYVNTLYSWPELDEDGKWDELELPEKKALYKLIKSKKFQKLFREAVEEEYVCRLDPYRGHTFCGFRREKDGGTPKFDRLVEMLSNVPTIHWEGIWSAEDWLQWVGPEDVGVTAQTPEKKLEEIANEIRLDAARSGYAIDGDIEAVLRRWRNELRED